MNRSLLRGAPLCAFAFLCLGAAAQTSTITPNVGLQIPSFNTPNWQVPTNANWIKIDQMLGGQTAIPALKISGNLTVSGTVTAPNLAFTNQQLVNAIGYTPLNPASNLSDLTNPALALQHLGGLSAQIPAVWSSGTTYAQYALAIGSDGVTYISNANGNLGNNPTAAGSTYWSKFAGGGAGGVTPGTQYAIPVYSAGGTQVGPSSVTVDSTGQNLTVPGISKVTNHVQEGPKVDVRFFGADPTGTNDSTADFQNALAYIAATVTNGQAAVLAVPFGNYKISSALRVTCNITVEGDGMGASAIQQTSATANAITLLPYSGQNLGDSCPGGMRSLTIEGTGHLGSGTLVEEEDAAGVTLENLRLFNGGGRGLNLEGSSERTKNVNLHIDSVRWPLQLTHNANENHWWGLNIADPGTDASGYCWGAMCVNGSYPISPPSTPAILSVSRTDSTHVTVTMTGTIPQGLEVGHYGALSGVTEDSTYNQNPALITALTQISGTQYTVTMQQTVSTAGPYTDGTWSIVWRPDIHQAVWVEAVNNWFHGGSVKALQFIGGMGFHSSENDGEDGIYFEGYPYDGEPRLNPAVVANGVMPLTSTTATITTSSTTVPVASTMWFPDYINDPQDISNCASYYYVLMPADALAGSTATSTAFPSVTRGTKETISGCFSGDGSFHFTGRGNPAYAWPTGSIIERGVASDYGNGAVIEHNHINSIESPSVAGFTTDCADQSWNGTTRSTSDYPVGFTTCADLLVGLAPDAYIGNPNGASAGYLNGGTFASIDDNSVFGGGTESVGEGYIKAFNDAIVLSHTPVNNAPFVTQAQITAGSLPTAVVANSFYQNILYGSATGMGGLTTPVYNFPPNDTEAGSNDFFGVGGSTGIGNNPGMNYSISGKSFTTSYCLSDRGANSGTQAITRLCAEGSPYFGGQTGGFSVQYWNGGSWTETNHIGNDGDTFGVPSTFNGAVTANSNVTYSIVGINDASTFTIPAGMQYMQQGEGGTVTLPAQVKGQTFQVYFSGNGSITFQSSSSAQIVGLGSNGKATGYGTSYTSPLNGTYVFEMDGSNYTLLEQPGTIPYGGAVSIGSFASGVSGSVTSGSTNSSGVIAVTTTASIGPSVDVAVLTFSVANTANGCPLAPQNDVTAAVGTDVYAGSITTTGFHLHVGLVALPAGSYQFSYACK